MPKKTNIQLLFLLAFLLTPVRGHACFALWGELLVGADLVVMGELRDVEHKVFSHLKPDSGKGANTRRLYDTATLMVDEVLRGPNNLSEVLVTWSAWISFDGVEGKHGGELKEGHRGIWLLYSNEDFGEPFSRYYGFRWRSEDEIDRVRRMLKLGQTYEYRPLPVEPPCTVESLEYYLCGGQGGVLKDKHGTEYEFLLDGQPRDRAEGESATKGPRMLYFGTTDSDAIPLPVGSQAEGELVDILQRWVDSRLWPSRQEYYLSVYLDKSDPEHLPLRSSLDEDELRALMIYRMMKFVRDQRARYDNPPLSEGKEYGF